MQCARQYALGGDSMNASIRGVVHVKADRINDRIDLFAKQFLREQKAKESENISTEDFKEFVKAMHIIVTTELNEKGVERVWKKK